MVITYSDAILRSFVAQICRDMGWNASHTTSLEVLTQITSQYMRQLAKRCVQFANHCGRQKPTFEDIGLAFNHFHIDVNELKDYINNVESTALDLPVPKFPITNVSNRVITNTAEEEDRPEWYYEWMPSLLETKTTGAVDESGETSKPSEDVLQDSMTSPPSTSQLAQEMGSNSPKRAISGFDSFGLLRDLYTSVGHREGVLPDSQRIIESDRSRDNSPEREEEIEEKIKTNEEKDKKRDKKRDKKEFKGKGEKKKMKINKENSLKIKAIISKDKIKGQKKMKKFLKIKELGKRSYSPLSIKVTGLTTGTPTATSTPTMSRSPSSAVSPTDSKAANASFASSIEAVIDRCCADELMDEGTPKKKYKLKRDESVEKKTKRGKKGKSTLCVSMKETIDEVVRQSDRQSSPNKRSPHPHLSPKVKAEPISMSSPKQSLNVQTFDDDEAAKTLVLMAGDKNVPKRKKNKPSATASAPPPDSPSGDSNSAFKSAMSSFPKVSPGLSPLSPTIFSMSTQSAFFPTPPLFGQMSPPKLTPVKAIPSEPYIGPPPTLTKPRTLAEKKAMPPELMNVPLIKKEKVEKENKTKERVDKEKGRKEKKSQKDKNKKYKSRKTISEDESSSEEDIKPKINIKLGSTARHSGSTDKLSVKTTADTKPTPKTLLSPKHNVQNQEELFPKKRGPKKKIVKEGVKEDKSCIVIRETITVDTGDGEAKVWICPACKGPDDGSPMIGKSTRSGLKY